MSRASRIPVLVLTGGLGSGKTTLLATWLRQSALQDAALVINEIGETGFDDRLLQPMMGAIDGAALVANACVCCTGLPGLSEALADLYRARLERRIKPFDCVVVETTGLAEPQPLRHAFVTDPVFSERFELAGVLATVSATVGPSAATTAAAGPTGHGDLLATRAELQAQISGADLLIITKGDRVPAGTVTALTERLRSLNPRATIVQSVLGDLPAAQALRLAAEAAAAALPVSAPPAVADAGNLAAQPRHRPASALHAPHDHARHAAHHHGAVTRFIALPAPVVRIRFAQRLARALDVAGPQLLRLKGIVLAEDGGAIAVQWAPGDDMAGLAPFAGPAAAYGLQGVATEAAALNALAHLFSASSSTAIAEHR